MNLDPVFPLAGVLTAQKHERRNQISNIKEQEIQFHFPKIKIDYFLPFLWIFVAKQGRIRKRTKQTQKKCCGIKCITDLTNQIKYPNS